MPPIRRYKWVGPGYVETMGNRLLAGRLLTWQDAYERRQVVMISNAFAREYFKTPADAIGKRIRNTPSNPWREIVGVIGDERDNGLARPPTPIVYWPLLVDDFWNMPKFVQRNLAFAVRSSRLGSGGAAAGCMSCEVGSAEAASVTGAAWLGGRVSSILVLGSSARLHCR